MKTKNKFIISTLVFILLELTCFVLLSSSKSILGVVNNFNVDNLLTLVSSIPFMLMYFYALTFVAIVCFKETNMFVFKEVWKLYKKNILFLVMFRLLTDITILLFTKVLGDIVVAKIIFETLFTFATFLFIIKRSEEMRQKIYKSKKIIITVILVAVVIIILLYIKKCCGYKNIINHYYEKYENATEDLFVNLYTKIDLLNMYISVFIHVCAFSLAYMLYGKDTYKKHQPNKSVFAYRVCLVFNAFLIYTIAFCIISPRGSLCGLVSHGGSSQHFNGPKHFVSDCYDTYFYRKRDYGWHTYNTYISEKVVIKYGNDVLFTYKPLIPIELSPSLKEIEGTTSYTYENDIIAYFDNDIPKAVFKKDIIKQEKCINLIQALESLISKGNFEFFEYGCEYLLKYDRDFIIPFIEKYAQGNLNNNQLDMDSNIKSSYMKDFSTELIEKYNL